MDLFNEELNIEQAVPLPHEKVLRHAVIKIENEFKEGWLFYQCKEENLLDIYENYKRQGIFKRLEFGAQKKYWPPKLSIELVPKTCWFNNVRSSVSKEDWKKIKKIVSTKANYRCEICGGRGPQWPVECHEIWNYDDEKLTQKLIGMIALCPSCHEVKHIGYTELRGKIDEATAHLALVNGWKYSEAKRYIRSASETWSKRSKKDWELDVSFLDSYGVTYELIDIDEIKRIVNEQLNPKKSIIEMTEHNKKVYSEPASNGVEINFPNEKAKISFFKKLFQKIFQIKK